MDIKWIDVDDRMPSEEEDGEDIFVVLENGMIFQEVWYVNGYQKIVDGRWYYSDTPIKYWTTIRELFEHMPNAHYAAWRKKETCDESKRESA